MALAYIKADFPCTVERLWDVVTSLEDYAWRSDLSRIEVTGKNNFIEYTTDGKATYYTVTAEEPYKKWEFTMENTDIKGTWVCTFSEEDGRAAVKFTGNIRAKKFYLNPLLKSYMKKHNKRYTQDLKKALKMMPE